VVVLDSEWDVGVIGTSAADLLRTVFDLTSDNEKSFLDAAPNSEGVSDLAMQLLSNSLGEVSNDAIVIVGLHAPLFNLWNDEFPYFLRETQRPALAALVVP